MDRPKVTKEIIAEAAQKIAATVDCDAETIASCYTHPMDGYQLAKAIDRNTYGDLTMGDVEELDYMSSIVSDLHRAAEKKWVEENDIKNPLPIGTKITRGVIKGICTHSAARYLVQENGCTNENRSLLVKFEDAVEVTPEINPSAPKPVICHKHG